MKKQLFTYAVLLHVYDVIPGGQLGAITASSSKQYKETKIIIEPKNILAKDEKEVLFKVTREIPEEFTSDPENVEILVRNF
jgi:hypothetical protein